MNCLKTNPDLGHKQYIQGSKFSGSPKYEEDIWRCFGIEIDLEVEECSVVVTLGQCPMTKVDGWQAGKSKW